MAAVKIVTKPCNKLFKSGIIVRIVVSLESEKN